MQSSSSPRTRGFNCANCGAAVELRALSHAVTVACSSCGSLLDPRDPNVVVLRTAAQRVTIAPKIPLGSRGTWQGHLFEVVGFQRRAVEVEGVEYPWDEYVLFNPYRGFRYLTEYDGHWNDVRTVRDLPEALLWRTRMTVKYQQATFRHFQTASAATQFVLGEFPWRVHLGDRVETSDYVAPPLLLSSEVTADETTWSLGTYTSGDVVWRAFGCAGAAPHPIGVFANQPNPHRERTGWLWRAGGLLALLLLGTFLLREVTASRQELFRRQYVFTPASASDSAFVSEPFTIAAPGTVSVDLHTDVRSTWVHFDLALINTATGTALNVDRDVEQFSGRDADGDWQEGSPDASVLLPKVLPGEYYLRVEPEGEAGFGPVPYTLALRQDVPSRWPYGIALVLLLCPPVVASILSARFEHRRWESGDAD